MVPKNSNYTLDLNSHNFLNKSKGGKLPKSLVIAYIKSSNYLHYISLLLWQAKIETRASAIMAMFFSLTTPVGVAIGLGLTSVYDENSPKALVVEGIFNAASAGILIYMALVDVLAADFMSPKLQNNGRLLFGTYVALLLGAGCMSLLARWA